MTKDITDILRRWANKSGELSARCIVGQDGTELLQLRIDLGILQMSFDGRPDGEKPFGQPSLLDHFLRVRESQPEVTLDAEMWGELDRELWQFYHRRRALLILGAQTQTEGEPTRAVRYYRRAVRDANHNLQIMDFIKSQSGDEDYVEGHERFRPFVLMHRTLAEAQAELLEKDADEAVERLKAGMTAIEEVYRESGAPEMASEDPSIMQLRTLEEQVRKEHKIVQTLREELDAAIRNEEFEWAAELRDRLRTRRDLKKPTDDA